MSVARLDLSTGHEPKPQPEAPVVFPQLGEFFLGPKMRPTAEDDYDLDVSAQRMIDDWLGVGDDPEIAMYRLIAIAAFRRDWDAHRLLLRLSGDEWWPNDRAGQAFTSMLARYVEEALEKEYNHFARESFVKEIEVRARDEHGNPSLLRETTWRELP